MTCCDLAYYCPQSSDLECALHGRLDLCCLRPDLHRAIVIADASGAGTTDVERSASAAGAGGRGVRPGGAPHGPEPVELPEVRGAEGRAESGPGLRGEVPGDRSATEEELIQRGYAPWACFHPECGRRYPHARQLVDHLMRLHGGDER
jgi:hypothetical protein